MALVLVEGGDKLPSILGASNITSSPKSLLSSGVATSNALGLTMNYVSSTGLVMCIATLLAMVF